MWILKGDAVGLLCIRNRIFVYYFKKKMLASKFRNISFTLVRWNQV